MKLISDIRKDIAGIETSPKKLRQFAYLVGGILIVLGCVYIWRRGAQPLFEVIAALGALLACVGIFAPHILKPLYTVWMTFGVVMGFFVFRVFLAGTYFLIVVPVGAILRMVGKDPLQLHSNKNQQSYWKKVEHKNDLSLPY